MLVFKLFLSISNTEFVGTFKMETDVFKASILFLFCKYKYMQSNSLFLSSIISVSKPNE